MREVDFYFSDDGDFIVDNNADLMDTSEDSYRSLIQGVMTRLNYNKNEWPGSGAFIGANMSEFQGMPNTAETGDKIRTRIISELTRHGFIKQANLNVTVVPLSHKTILCKIMIKVANNILQYNYRFSFRERTAYAKGDS